MSIPMNIPNIALLCLLGAFLLAAFFIGRIGERRSRALNPKPDQDDAIFVRDAIKVATVLGSCEGDGDHYYSDGQVTIFYDERRYIPRVQLGSVTVFDINGFNTMLQLDGQFALRQYMSTLFVKAVAREADNEQLLRDSMNTALDNIKESLK